ncbi:MAG: ribokinase [Verrucomicrobiota bacterium]
MARPSAANIVVIGSLNVDFIAQVPHLPGPGDAVVAAQLEKRFGGKGGNQALSAVRQGAQVMLIGNLGDDPDGRDYRNHLRREAVNCSSLNTVRGTTGSAYVTVDPKGRTHTVIIPGANGQLTGPSIKMQRPRIAVTGALLIQLEIPLEPALDAIRIANEAKVPVVLNASPITPDFPWGEVKIDVLIVNQHEARQLFETTISSSSANHESWKERLAERKIRHLIITRGATATLSIGKSGVDEVPVQTITPVDTVGAGDVFAGAFTAHYAEGTEIVECIRWANTAAALSTLKSGAQEGVPYRGDVQSVLGTVRSRAAAASS